MSIKKKKPQAISQIIQVEKEFKIMINFINLFMNATLTMT